MKNIKKKIIIWFLLTSTLFLSSCLWAITEIMCDLWWVENMDHCYQAAAIQEADDEWCEKIKWSDFSSMWSNPPKDKCYKLIAENTWDISSCDKIEWWYASYTKEECILNASKKHTNPSWCMMLSWAAKKECMDAVWPKLTVWEALDMDKAIEDLKKELKKWPDKELEEQLKWLEKRKKDYVDTLPKDKKERYENLSDPLNKEIRLDSYRTWDKKTRDALLALNEAARKRWETIPRKEYEAIRDMLKWKNDPKNDIEQMDDDELLKPRRYEKISKAKEALKFWKANPTEKEKKLDQQLLFYQRMLERQAAIDKWYTEKQQEFNREYDNLKKKWEDTILWKINDKLKKEAFWDLLDGDDLAWKSAAILWEALDVVKEEAKNSEFRWLVNAYDKWMAEELSNYNWNIEAAHEAVKKRLQEDPYYYEDKRVFSKYGNLIENQECWPKNNNPLCLNKDIFFKAMKKSYKYQNKKK